MSKPFVWNTPARIKSAAWTKMSVLRAEDSRLRQSIEAIIYHHVLLGQTQVHEDRYSIDRLQKVKAEDIEERLRQLGGKIISVERYSKTAVVFVVVWPHAAMFVHVSGMDRMVFIRRYRRRMGGSKIRGERSICLCNVGIDFISTMRNDPIPASLTKFLRTHRKPEAPLAKQVQRKVFMLSTGRFGLSLRRVGRIAQKIERDNYDEQTLEDFDHVVSDISNPDPCGRLVLVHGSPGTGKTFFVRGLIEAAANVAFVLVPAQLVSQLTSPQLGTLLAKMKIGTCLIVEDADSLLVNRLADNISGVSAILNLADGIFGALTDVRLICTTNAKRLDFDEAILRDGRLCRKIEIGELPPERATEVLQRLVPGSEHRWEGKTPLASVYKMARALLSGNGQKQGRRRSVRSVGFQVD